MTVEEAKGIIDEVLSSEEYSPKRLEMPEFLRKILRAIGDFLDKILEKAIDLISRLLSRLNLSGVGAGTAKAVRVIVIAVLALLAAALVGAIVLFALRLLKRKKKKNGEADADAQELASFAEQPEEALRLSELRRQEGNIREAFRYLFISLLVQMNRREIIAIRLYKTNRVYRREMLASGMTEEAQVAPFFRTFNEVRFGGRDMSAADYDAFRQRYDLLLADTDRRLSSAKNAGKGTVTA